MRMRPMIMLPNSVSCNRPRRSYSSTFKGKYGNKTTANKKRFDRIREGMGLEGPRDIGGRVEKDRSATTGFASKVIYCPI
jgi:hypothetical protein